MRVATIFPYNCGTLPVNEVQQFKKYCWLPDKLTTELPEVEFTKLFTGGAGLYSCVVPSVVPVVLPDTVDRVVMMFVFTQVLAPLPSHKVPNVIRHTPAVRDILVIFLCEAVVAGTATEISD